MLSRVSQGGKFVGKVAVVFVGNCLLFYFLIKATAECFLDKTQNNCFQTNILYGTRMNQDIEAKNCQDILRKNNLYPIKRLGKGAFGIVYLVSRASMKGYEAELFSVKCTNKKNFVKKPMLKRYLKQEIDIQSHIDHYNVVKLIRTFEDEGWNFMIMEYCDLGNLYTFQAQKPKKIFDFNQAKKYVADTLDGLRYLHSNNVIHRDLKLENILLTRDNQTQEIRAKICDFGFAKQTQEQASTFCGTTYFMAPEIFAKKKYEAYVDIWSVGVILFYMLFAIYPFKSMNMAAQIESKCKNGFNLEQIKGAENPSLTKQDRKMLGKLFERIFRLQPQERISLGEFRKLMATEEIERKMSAGELETLEADSDEEFIEFLSQKIIFAQKVYQEIKGLRFLSNLEELALKFYLDKYCVTLLLSNKKLCNSNPAMLKLKNEITNNQQKDASILIPNLSKIQISRFEQIFSTQNSDDFSTYKQSYRIVLSHVFSKANKLIQDPNTRSQMKLKIFCCHSINRVFDQQYIKDVFTHFFSWRQKKLIKTQFKLDDIMKWIELDSVQKINDTVRILCDKFYRKTK